MPGKKVGEYAWRYLSQMQLLRDVQFPDDPLDISAIPESIDHYTNLDAAYQNELVIAAMLAGSLTGATITVYVDPRALDGNGQLITDEYRWCKLAKADITESELIVLNDVPPGIIKVVVTNITNGSSASSMSSASPADFGVRISFAKSS